VIAGPGDNTTAAGRRGNGRLRVSRGDREQVIELLKAAFVEDRLTKEELDARVGRVLASRTRADLAVVTADITAGPNAGQMHAGPPGGPARARVRGGPPVSNAAKAGMAVGVAVAVATVLAFATSIPPAFLFIVSFFFTALLAGAWLLISRDEERSRRELPPQPRHRPEVTRQLSFCPATPCS
jgi:Domain of unknown function (DUF1707)